MDTEKTLTGFLALIIGLVLIPIVAYFSSNPHNNSSVNKISGMSTITQIVAYLFAFGLIFIGIKTIISGRK